MDKSPLGKLLIVFVYFFLTSCGGGGSSSNPDNNTANTVLSGRFIDSAVEGIRYQTATRSGTTDATGSFQFLYGETVSFFVGDIPLGSALGSARITPIDLVAGAFDTSNQQVVNIIRFLQSLDGDGNPENGIQISSDIVNLAGGQTLDFSLDTAAFETVTNVLLNYLTSGSVTTLVNSSDAIDHLNSSLGIDTSVFASGSVSISGADVTSVGSSFAPSIGYATSGDSGSVSMTMIQFGSGTRNITIGINEYSSGFSIAVVQFMVATGSNFSDVYRYLSDCNMPCSELTVDMNAQTVSFNSLSLTADDKLDNNAATGSVTLNGALTWP